MIQKISPYLLPSQVTFLRFRHILVSDYRQFCKQYSRWCETNKKSMHITAVSGQKMEVDFAGKTFQMVEHLTGELLDIVVFCLPSYHTPSTFMRRE